MRTVGPALKVGITFVLVMAGGYWAFMMLAKGDCAGEERHLALHAYFRDATLLVEKSRVQIAGLVVGYITSRELNVRPPTKKLILTKRFAKISIQLTRPVTLYTNAVVYKRAASLLGDFYLEIDPGTYEWVDAKGKRHVGEKLKNGDRIQFVVEAATTTGVVQQVSEMLPAIKGLVKDIRRFTKGPLLSIGKNINDGISENREAVKGIMKNIEAVTKDVRGITTGAGSDVKRILSDIKVITSQVRGMVDDADSRDTIKKGVAKLSRAVDSLDKAMANAKGISEDVKDITGGIAAGKGNVGRLLKDEALIDTVEDTVRDASGLLKSFTSLQTVVGLRTEYNFQAGTIKTYVSVELRPRPDKYYLIELIDDPRGRREMITEISRSTDPNRPMLTRNDVVRLSDAFRITFQFAKRIGFATFRFGIKESTGGVGVDLSFLNEDLQVWVDAFDAQSNVYPRFKMVAAWRFFSRLYIVGGVDDALNARPGDGIGGGRDFFLGASLRFNDRDLRSLLMVGGGALGGVGK